MVVSIKATILPILFDHRTISISLADDDVIEHPYAWRLQLPKALAVNICGQYVIPWVCLTNVLVASN